MYQTCEQCGIKKHISTWEQISPLRVKCPSCGYVQHIRVIFETKVSEIALAKVGIIALIDEATKYQEVRPRFALKEILQKESNK